MICLTFVFKVFHKLIFQEQLYVFQLYSKCFAMFLSINLTLILSSITQHGSGYLQIVVRSVLIMQQRQPPRGGEHVGTRTEKVVGDELINLINYQPTLTQSM